MAASGKNYNRIHRNNRNDYNVNFVRRQVSFKPGPGLKGRQRGRNLTVRRQLDEGDLNVTSVPHSPVDLRIQLQRKSYQRRGEGYRPGVPNFNGHKLLESSSSWYKVTISYGKKYNRLEIIKNLQSFIQPVVLLPICVRLEDDDMTFFVDNFETAQRLSDANFKLQMRDGWKIQIKVEARMPNVEPNAELIQKIKEVMSNKYDTITCSLDLSRFHTSREFLENDLFVPLNRQTVLLCVFQIIAENVPDMRELNLSENKIFTTEHFSMLKRYATNLKSLDLSKNKINDLSYLNCLQDLGLENLILEDNPLCYKYDDQTTYVREVRKLFKQLLRLDGVNLPPPVNFDIEENSCKLPQSRGSYVNSVEETEFLKTFVEQYFQMYDDQYNRRAIATAYVDNAQFSMNVFNLNGWNVSKYITESRNLKRVSNFERRTKQLHVGKPEILRIFDTLPKTHHDFSSFTVDLVVFLPHLISMVVHGVFREIETLESETVPLIRTFQRVFVLVPEPSADGRFNIVNDMLSITNATQKQINKAFEQQPSTSMQPSASTSFNLVSDRPNFSVDNVASRNSLQNVELDEKRKTVTLLAMRTEMNLLWSEKCLIETDWDFDKALHAFTEFNKLGQIPAEAFSK